MTIARSNIGLDRTIDSANGSRQNLDLTRNTQGVKKHAPKIFLVLFCSSFCLRHTRR
jgi:hypothetical protein